jgi:hypothetical protein
MTAAFTQHYATEQAREERQRAENAERLANIERAKHHVIVYAWPKVCHSVARGFVADLTSLGWA